MPCMTYSAEEQLSQTSREVLRLHRLLCKAYSIIEKAGKVEDMPDDLRSAYEHHKTVDRERKEQQAIQRYQNKLKREALSKLTPEERKVLGYKE